MSPPPNAAPDDQRACLAREEREILSWIVTRGRSRLGGMIGGHGRAKPSDRLPITSVANQSGGIVGGTKSFRFLPLFCRQNGGTIPFDLPVITSPFSIPASLKAGRHLPAIWESAEHA